MTQQKPTLTTLPLGNLAEQKVTHKNKNQKKKKKEQKSSRCQCSPCAILDAKDELITRDNWQRVWFQNSILIFADIYLIKQQKDQNIQEIRNYVSALFPCHAEKKNYLKKPKNESK